MTSRNQLCTKESKCHTAKFYTIPLKSFMILPHLAVLCSAMETELCRRFARLSVSMSSIVEDGAKTTKSRSPYHLHRQCARPGKSLSTDMRSSHTVGMGASVGTKDHYMYTSTYM